MHDFRSLTNHVMSLEGRRERANPPATLQDVIPSRVQERAGGGILSVFRFTSGGKSYTIIFALRAVDLPARTSFSLQRQFFAPAFYCVQYVYCSKKPFGRKAIET